MSQWQIINGRWTEVVIEREKPEPKPPKSTLVIATDASVKYGVASWSLFDAEGKADYGIMGESVSSTIAELYALTRAIMHRPEHPKILITDSLNCVELVEELRVDGVRSMSDQSKRRFDWHKPYENRAIRRFSSLLRTSKVSIEIYWVRGHNGFELNELADRLARMVRRGRELGFDKRDLGRVKKLILEDYKAGLKA